MSTTPIFNPAFDLKKVAADYAYLRRLQDAHPNKSFEDADRKAEELRQFLSRAYDQSRREEQEILSLLKAHVENIHPGSSVHRHGEQPADSFAKLCISTRYQKNNLYFNTYAGIKSAVGFCLGVAEIQSFEVVYLSHNTTWSKERQMKTMEDWINNELAADSIKLTESKKRAREADPAAILVKNEPT